ncbi:MAG: EamA family transporter [Vicinamibacterales bacterium]
MRSPRASALRTLVAFAVIYLGWGSTFLAVRVAVTSIPPLLVGASRNLVAGSLLVGAGLLSGAGRPSAAAAGRALTIGVLMFVANHGAIAWASTRNPSGITALLVATIPLWILVFEWRRGDTARPPVRAIVGLGLGFAGSLLLLWPSAGGTRLDPLASVVTGLAAISWAAGTLTARHAHLSESVALATGLPMLLGGTVLAAASAAAGEWSGLRLAAIRPESGASLAYLIVVGSLAGFSAYLYLLRTMPASRVVTYAYVNPVVALALGAWLGGESLDPGTLAAAAVSLAGVYLSVSSR